MPFIPENPSKSVMQSFRRPPVGGVSTVQGRHTIRFSVLTSGVHDRLNFDNPSSSIVGPTAASLSFTPQRLIDVENGKSILVTTETDVRYVTGFLTRFWESPSRAWYVIVPASGNPIAVIPSIGAALMSTTWIEDIRTWRAPDLQDDGVGLL